MNEENKKVIALYLTKINIETQHQIYVSVYQRIKELGYALVLINTSNDMYHYNGLSTGDGDIFSLVNYDLIDGVIILSETIKDDIILNHIISSVKSHNVPIVSIDKHIPEVYNINFDYSEAMEKIVRHIVEYHKCKRVNFIAGIKGNSFSEERVDAYRKVLIENGIPVEEDRIGYGDFWDMPTVKALDTFFSSDLELPEAIICANDTMAITTCEYLNNKGYKIPDDIIVTGFDGIEPERYHIPRLTNAKQNNELAGKTAVDILHQIFTGNTPTQKDYKIKHQVVISSSCGCKKTNILASNSLLSTLYRKIENFRYYECKMRNMICSLNDSKAMYDLIDKIPEFAKGVYSDEMWICLCDEFLNNVEKDTSTPYKTMHLIYHGNQLEMFSQCTFDAKEILPNFNKILNEGRNFLMFSPLHLQERTIGYMAIIVDPLNFEFSYDNYNTFNDNISKILEIVQTREHLKSVISQLEKVYIRDYLTGLLNRRGFYQQLEDKLSIVNCDDNMELMVISIDLNGLKYINDVFGHNEGDNSIKTIANYLVSSAVNEDVCARFGGDEFVVANAIPKGSNYPKSYIDNFKQSIVYYNNTSNKPYKIGASCGYVISKPTSISEVDEMIKKADNIMYIEKSNTKYIRGR